MFFKKNFIVLSGGGAKGIAHLVFLQQILNNPIKGIVGTSAGALAGALFSFFNKDLNKITEHIEKIYNCSLFKEIDNHFSRKKGLFRFPEQLISQLKLLKGIALFNMDTFEKLLYDIFGEVYLENLSIPLYITAINLNNGHYTVFTRGKLVPILLSSMAIPGIFPPQKIKRNYYSDGGYLDNLPVSIAYFMRANRVFLSDISHQFKHYDIDTTALNLLLHVQNIHSENINHFERSIASFYMRFDLSKFNWYDFQKYKEILNWAKKKNPPLIKSNGLKMINKKFLRKHILLDVI